ncbi:MAG TPA: amidohydrolase family protein [Terriglobia bacterium]|nr:amidohydrolase family protein [Terriglobia bacterium]
MLQRFRTSLPRAAGIRQAASRLAIAVLLAGLGACSEAKTPEPPAEGGPPVTVIDGARLWDGTGAPAVDDAVLVIQGDRILNAGPRSTVTVPAGAKTVDAKGKTVIPGLINLHGHVGIVEGLDQNKTHYSKESVRANLEQYGRYGVTTTFSLGLDTDPAVFGYHGVASADEPARPALFVAGRGFTGKNGYPAVLKGLGGVPVEVDSVDDVKAHIQELADQKADVVKIWVDDHLGHYKKIRPELSKAIIEEAHKQNLKVVAHVFYLADAKMLVEAGIDGLAHSVRDREVDDALIKMMKEMKTFSVSTLMREEGVVVYAEPPAFLDDVAFTQFADPEVIKTLKDPAWGKKVKSDPDFAKLQPMFKVAEHNLKKLFDAGVKIGFGTDTGPPGRFHGYFEHLELERMVQAGLTPEQVLKIATLGSAECMGLEKDFGSLEKGKRADFIILDENPLENIVNSRKINQVWIGGRQVSR